MRLLLVITVLLLLGPLRRWVGRHWAFLFSVIAGGAFGLLLGAWVVGTCGSSHTGLPLLWAVVGAIAAARIGPSILRDIEKDGKNGKSSRRH